MEPTPNLIPKIEEEMPPNERDILWYLFKNCPEIRSMRVKFGCVLFLMDLIIGSLKSEHPIGNLFYWSRENHVPINTVYRWKKRLIEQGVIEDVQDQGKSQYVRVRIQLMAAALSARHLNVIDADDLILEGEKI